jgi:ribosome maturation factor RimP
VYRDIPDDMKKWIEPVVEDHGYELMNVETVRGSGPSMIRITIDTPSGDGRVPVDDLARISREVETQFDAADAIGEAYRLEVSSPGLDRLLAREKDFVAACGTEIKLRTRRPLEGRRRFRGTLVDYSEGVARISVDGQVCDVPFQEVEKANTIYTFSSADFNGSGACRDAD